MLNKAANLKSRYNKAVSYGGIGRVACLEEGALHGLCAVGLAQDRQGRERVQQLVGSLIWPRGRRG